jgi:hypothetical protein
MERNAAIFTVPSFTTLTLLSQFALASQAGIDTVQFDKPIARTMHSATDGEIKL